MIIRLRRIGGLQGLLLGLLVINLFLSIALTRFSIAGLPVRTLVLLLILGVLFLTATNAIVKGAQQVWPGLLIIGYMAFLAVVVSLVAGNSPETIIRQMIELHIQAAISLVTGAALVRMLGPDRLGLVFLFLVALSGAVAVLQFLHLEIGWIPYDFFTKFMPREVPEYMDYRYRAAGISYSPIHIGTQTCLAFAVALALIVLRDGDFRIFRRPDWRVFIVGFVAVAICLVTGNRSPLLGLIAFFAVYVIIVRPAVGIVLAVGALALMPFFDQILGVVAETGLRAANTENSSAVGRSVLQAYGLRLLFDNPLGYGVEFNSTDYWQYYWDALGEMDNARSITVNALHNYFLMILNKHGVLALAAAAPTLWLIIRKPFDALMFLPYVIHIYYHNDGPLQGDFFIWLLFPIFGALPQQRFWRAPAPRVATTLVPDTPLTSTSGLAQQG